MNQGFGPKFTDADRILREKPAGRQNGAGDLPEAVKSSEAGELPGGLTPMRVKVQKRRKTGMDTRTQWHKPLEPRSDW